jgi:hypothetical protein
VEVKTYFLLDCIVTYKCLQVSDSVEQCDRSTAAIEATRMKREFSLSSLGKIPIK